MRRGGAQSGQAIVLVAFALVALIGSAALVLLAGSFESQRNQLQQLADEAALDSALKIGIGCTAASAASVVTEADAFVQTQRSGATGLVTSGSCAASYTGTDSFNGGLSETIQYPYRAHQQQVEVILTLTLPISFGSQLGQTSTTVVRRAVAQELEGSTTAVSAGTLSCTGGQVNVAGSIATTNAIVVSGGCAVYAHMRFDAASGTYSDLGNASVYASGQSWVNVGGSCSAGALSGSTNAICGDGYQVSGHVPVTCGTSGTSAFLSAADAAIDPNPCAAGTAPQPAAPLSTTLPPEPNTDAAAINTLPGKVACAPGTVYPNLVVAGTTIGTAEVGTTAPAKDAAGFYHFKPSCYGYLDLASMKVAGIANRQVGPTVNGKHNLKATIPLGSLAGSLLVATINAEETPNKFTAPANWVEAAQVDVAGAGRTEIWYLPVAFNGGGVTSATFTIVPASIKADTQLTEWTGAAALDVTGTASNAGSLSATVSTGAATAQAAELVITADGFNKGVGGQAFASGAGWNNIAKDTANGFASEYRLDLPAAVASETVTGAPSTPWSLAIASFKAGAPNAGAVFDPGFYYFNGIVGAGGGICLNGAELLGQDVTLEFVNQAGFSSGNCAVGGSTTCTGPDCGFGSVPCSVSACPPNVPEDAGAGGYTWLAAPCNQAPSGDASCPGSAWCTVGDRACWNLLVWTPAASTGQIALKGTFEAAWMLGSVYWAGTCTDTVNGSSALDGTISCGTLAVSAAAGAGMAVGSDYGVSTATVEAILVE